MLNSTPVFWYPHMYLIIIFLNGFFLTTLEIRYIKCSSTHQLIIIILLKFQIKVCVQLKVHYRILLWPIKISNELLTTWKSLLPCLLSVEECIAVPLGVNRLLISYLLLAFILSTQLRQSRSPVCTCD